MTKNDQGFKKILVVSDNEEILSALTTILQAHPTLTESRTYTLSCSPKNTVLAGKTFGSRRVEPKSMKTDYETIVADYDLVISAHSKQIFPEGLVRGIPCINVHPGYNPYNRGWYPQVFSILNGLPLGATIHEIDEQLDHGGIIAQEKVEVHSWDTSLTAYRRVQQMEISLIERYLPEIVAGTYKSVPPTEEGNLNLKKDFEALREINLQESVTFGEAINRLRALTHDPFSNAYFIDPPTGERVWLKLTLEKDQEKQ